MPKAPPLRRQLVAQTILASGALTMSVVASGAQASASVGAVLGAALNSGSVSISLVGGGDSNVTLGAVSVGSASTVFTHRPRRGLG